MPRIVWSLLTICLLAPDCLAQLPPPAKVITPRGEAPVFEDEYFTDYHGNPCDFNTDGDFERIAEFGAGIKGRMVKRGGLSFTTSENDNHFYFGRWFHPKGRLDIPDENIGYRWPMYGLNTLKVRLKQSLESSTWKIGYRVVRRARGNVPGQTGWLAKGRKIEGTDWQEVSIPFFVKGRNWRTLYFETVEKGNAVRIDYVKIVNVRTPVCYRKKVLLKAKPVYAKLRTNLATEYFICVNGKQAHYYHGFFRKDPNPAVDITRYLRKGVNVLAIGSPNTWHWNPSGWKKARPIHQLVCRGIMLTQDGKYHSLSSDGEWKASFSFDESWHAAEFNDRSWERVKVGKARGIKGGPLNYITPLVTRPEGDLIFRLADGIDFSVTLPKHHRVSYVMKSSFTGEEESKGTLERKPRGSALDTHRLTYKPDRPGVWIVTLQMLDMGVEEADGRHQIVWNAIAKRNLEVAVAGPIKQKLVNGDSATEGMELRKIVHIDCTDESGHKPYRVRATGGIPPKDGKVPHSQILATPIGKYRESGNAAYGGFGYQFSVENLYRPHLIEVEYPDDKARLMMVKAFSSASRSPNWSWDQRWYSGVATGGGAFPPGDTFRKLYLFYWPDVKPETNQVQIITERAGLRAAVRSIRIYEIDDLPALNVPATPHRLFGMFVEREAIVTRTFASGKYDPRFKWYGTCYHDRMGRLRDWYDVTENLIKYMRFSGQNLYVPGYCMYTGIYFPETRGQSRGGGAIFEADHFRIMAAMFEANDLYLLYGVQYMTVNQLVEKAHPTNWEVLHEGKTSMYGISADGHLSVLSGSASSGAMDFQSKEAEEDLYVMLRTFLEYGKDYRSVKGMLFHTAGIGFPSYPVIYIGGERDSALFWGLDDPKIAEFAKATGITMPGDAGDPDRMLKRYRYLLDSPDVLEKWNRYRCRRMHSQVVSMLKMVQKERPDWKFYVNPTGPAPAEWRKCLNGEISHREANRRRGYDYALFKKKGIVNSTGGPVRYLHESGRIEEDLPAHSASGYWYCGRWPVPAHSQAVLPVEPYAARDHVKGLMHLTPPVIACGKADVVNISGGEHRLRPFVRAYRSIPVGKYRRLRGNGLDNNLVIRAARVGGRTVFYIVNPHQYHMDATLTFSGRAKLTDLVTGREVALQEKRTKVLVSPYDLEVFSVTTSLVAAETELAELPRRLVQERLEAFDYCRRLPADKGELFAEKWRIGKSFEELLADIAVLEGIHEKGNQLRIVNISGMTHLRRFLNCIGRYRVVEAPPRPRDACRVNCAAVHPYTDSQGNEWLPDKSYLFAIDDYGYVGGGMKALRGSIKIEKTKDEPIYRSELYKADGYRFLVPNGRYTVRLHFAETYKGILDMRVFHVAIEGTKVLEKFDVFAEAGFRTALTKEFKGIEVTDGELEIDFTWDTVNPAEINGIEVLKE